MYILYRKHKGWDIHSQSIFVQKNLDMWVFLLQRQMRFSDSLFTVSPFNTSSSTYLPNTLAL